jgi:predicted molibdopterin-dependent oxidoreductase YjgC
MWNGILQLLVEEKAIDPSEIRKIDGGTQFLEGKKLEAGKVAAITGIDAAAMRKAAGVIGQAKRVVIIHSPDRVQDQAEGDLQTLGNLIVLLRAAGVKADLLLPRVHANGAALKVVGADPAFGPGMVSPPPGIAGAKTREELRAMLEGGKLRGALIIGEDPLAWETTGAWFGNVEFLVAMDWTDTETTRKADVALPGATYLETAGTRCGFDGALIRYSRVAEPPAGVSGDAVLKEFARSFGLTVPDDTTASMDAFVREKLGERARFYWNTGEKRESKAKPRLVPVSIDVARTGAILPPLTHAEKYKHEIRKAGTQRYRVRN